MKSIVLIQPYFGKWPLWFDAHLISIAKNPTVDWLFITDCEIPDNVPTNAKFISTTLDLLNKKINKTLEVVVPLSPRKLCDIRPAYGKVFQEYIEDYDFWGFCDADIIWGDIRQFITNEKLCNHDIISSRKKAISGHFTIFRNSGVINNFYKTIPQYNQLIKQSRYMWAEEQVLTKHLLSQVDTLNTPRICWDSILCNKEKGIDSHQEFHLDRWLWKEGKMINTKTQEEVMYLHFINWKRNIRSNEVVYTDTPQQFYISHTGMHYKKHSKLNVFFNAFNNVFNGYWIRERRRIKKNKIKRINKRIMRKLKFK